MSAMLKKSLVIRNLRFLSTKTKNVPNNNLNVQTQASSTKNEYLNEASEINNEFTETPRYPPILDLSYEKCLERRKQAQYDEIAKVQTVEEKQIKLNMPKFYGFTTYCFREEQAVPYNNLPLVQHITQTHITDYKQNENIELNIDRNLLSSQIEDSIIMEWEKMKSVKNQETFRNAVIKQINRVFVNNLTDKYPHLLDAQFDDSPRIESFWCAGGLDPPEQAKRYRRGIEWTKQFENKPTDRYIAYIGNPILTVRAMHPLIPVMDVEEAVNLPVENFKYDPRVVGTFTEYRHAANIPGFWPGDPHRFGILSYHKRPTVYFKHNGTTDIDEAIKRQAVLTSFGWLQAQANYLGYTTFNEIEQPLCTQTIITDGRVFNSFVYQLNSIALYGERKDGYKVNILGELPAVELYKEITNEGKLIGFNPEALIKQLLRFYTNVPNSNAVMPNTKTVADCYGDNQDKCQWLEREYKYLMSNRPRFKLDYEIYHWEKIYKIDHKMRPMEKRMRPFELFVKPWDRRLDARQPNYIPRKLRPDLPRHKGRYAKEYFP